jgi:adenosylcobinamide kinase/adenosylcobinamide-phosphate guanylyltransferase
VLGGARSGKSRFAETLITAQPGPYLYVATAQVLDDEMHLRIQAHRRRRGDDWETRECPFDVVPLLQELPTSKHPVLVDCLTLWMSNWLLRQGASAAENQVEALAGMVSTLPYPLVLVSNEVGGGIVPDNTLARQFRDLAGFANQELARVCSSVTLVVAGLPMCLK